MARGAELTLRVNGHAAAIALDGGGEMPKVAVVSGQHKETAPARGSCTEAAPIQMPDR